MKLNEQQILILQALAAGHVATDAHHMSEWWQMPVPPNIDDFCDETFLDDLYELEARGLVVNLNGDEVPEGHYAKAGSDGE